MVCSQNLVKTCKKLQEAPTVELLVCFHFSSLQHPASEVCSCLHGTAVSGASATAIIMVFKSEIMLNHGGMSELSQWLCWSHLNPLQRWVRGASTLIDDCQPCQRSRTQTGSLIVCTACSWLPMNRPPEKRLPSFPRLLSMIILEHCSSLSTD